ncbi:MAG TPA: CBS domain-containing protein [Candidatus Thermoplasmatota archaeon]|jgi:CBS domain-containing protein|nr:CBS domain-containing protein [Candidatus Thermoplasmatota archaeon]
MLVRDIMASPPVTAAPDLTVLDAARLMKERNIGSLIVEDNHRPVGILTERDLVGKVVAQGLDPRATHVRELMSTPLLTVPPEMDVLEAARAMARHHVRRLPVINGSKLLGIVSERDILEVSPDLIEVTRTLGGAAEELAPEEAYMSKCEACNSLSDGLRAGDGMLLCEDCWQERETTA